MITGVILIVLSLSAIWLSEAATWLVQFRPARDRAALQWALVTLGSVGLVLGAFMTFTGRALAAEAASAAADLRPLWGYGVEIIGGGLSLLAGIATRAATKHMAIRNQDRIRDYLDRAMQLGIQYAMELAIRKGEDLAQVEVRDQLVASAATYAARAVPDALRSFGIDDAGLKDRLRARLPEIVPHPDQPSVFGAVSRAE